GIAVVPALALAVLAAFRAAVIVLAAIRAALLAVVFAGGRDILRAGHRRRKPRRQADPGGGRDLEQAAPRRRRQRSGQIIETSIVHECLSRPEPPPARSSNVQLWPAVASATAAHPSRRTQRRRKPYERE
ncbi:MAG TPA: hypothetical protein VFI22_04190, partial [Thermomicrobiales bacterium]|nr:hypothetical protein [Thermomicrobiales bacterium]